tara:strand:+ start:140 stop:451 length:312 start_codon:yes stop_codon:yes gene_type:complete
MEAEATKTFLGFITDNLGIVGGTGAAGLVLWLLKKIPNDKLYGTVESLFSGIGTTITLGLAKWKVTRSVWNHTIEPWFIDLVDNTVGAAVNGFIKGLRSDNDK